MNSKHLASDSEFPALQDGKLRFYSMRFCPYAQRGLLAIAAKGIPTDIVNINLSDKPKWLFERNPTGKVPTIETAQGPLYESLVILEYLDEVYPGRKLISTDPFQKALDKIWVERATVLITLFYKILSGRDDAEGTANRFKEFEQGLAPLEAELKSRGTPFFGGSEPGFLDYSIWPWFERLPVFKIMFPNQDFENAKAQHPLMEKWRQAMKEDSAVKASYVSPQIHHDFIISYLTGKANYEILH